MKLKFINSLSKNLIWERIIKHFLKFKIKNIMSTLFVSNENNFKDPEIAKRIKLLLKRIQADVKNCEISVTDFNADPVEFIYTFKSSEEAIDYQKNLSTTFKNNVIENKYYEYRPVSSLPSN